MFQTDLNHLLQSFASEPLTAFMRFITALGYVEFFMIFLFVILLAVHLKKGFILFLILLWTAVVTFILKDYFELPRPFHVDSTLQFLDGQLPDDSDFKFSKRGAVGFWDPLPADVLEVTRQSDTIEHGFPSGHTSVAIAFWGAIMLLYREKWIKAVCIALMILIPLSRIYLGVHFLADVLGGMAVGGFMLGLFYMVVLSPTKLSTFLDKDRYVFGPNAPTILLLLAPLPFLFVLPARVAVIVGLMVGLGLGYLLLARKGIPTDDGTIMQRIGRLLLGLVVAGLIGLIVKTILGAVGLEEESWSDFVILFVFIVGLIWIGTEISVRTGMYRRGVENS